MRSAPLKAWTWRWRLTRPRRARARHDDRGNVDRAGALEHHAGEVAALERCPFTHVDRAVAEVGVGRRVLDDRRHPGDRLAIELRLEPWRMQQVAPVERPDARPCVVPLAQPGLQLRMRVDPFHHAGIEPDTG